MSVIGEVRDAAVERARAAKERKVQAATGTDDEAGTDLLAVVEG
ncbi:hypothetical protein [Geodermatophilus obscurus]|uniref:Uncharacterized protein n=1 Tax=Geodermatophilus obscurus (strain ATCC 25078 / DSM 43160 / JCM 3152 / CCUG 61914 / KCC A-0152 / KCTC 9177 / NBRC 13315 / NRRL B-3577 / G-20) TaxID=526225 RepID=D2S763_GEOOG|nr:hypothetical protein [Geodermatophilus obscurus]ADB73363.1 hypothetical protein Gobs_0582 [Geodermatophilus obscurus DSM 43160]